MQKTLHRQIEKLIRHNGTSATKIGYILTGDPSFVTKLRNGHRFRDQTLARAKTRLPRLKREAAR